MSRRTSAEIASDKINTGKIKQEEIQDHLAALNYTSTSYGPYASSARATAIGVTNHLKWFKENNIEVHQVYNSPYWELGPEPVGPRPKTSKMYGGC
jgi:hypothetical protein